jgi:predicted secreted protein
MSIPQFANFRRFVLTGSIAGVTATGAWYGAGLKMKQDIKQVLFFHLPSPLVSSLTFFFPFSYSSISIFWLVSQTNLFLLLPLHRKNKKQPKQHHSNKSPNCKPTVPT